MVRSTGKTLSARVPWVSCATNQRGAAGHEEGATDWQGAVGHRGAQYRAMHRLTQAPPARDGVMILHMCVGPNPLLPESEGMEQWQGQTHFPATSPDLNSSRAAGHQVFAEIPPDGDSAFSSLLCSGATAHHLIEHGRKPPRSSRMGPRWERHRLCSPGFAKRG